MPVITRNQRKNIVASLEKHQAIEPVVNHYVIEKVRPHLNNLLSWFISVANEKIKEVKKYDLKQIEIRHLIKCRPKKYLKSKKTMESEVRTLHFDNIRRITELMFFVEQYLPEVYNLSSSIDKFSKLLYVETRLICRGICGSDMKPETEDERNAVIAIINVFQDFEKNIIPLLSADVSLKRLGNFVDYTGMDTIEHESEYDAITDIWFDLTQAEDPDYVPTEDEEDDYVPEDNINVYEENEIIEILVQSNKSCEEPRKIFKSSNHILFEYDE